MRLVVDRASLCVALVITLLVFGLTVPVAGPAIQLDEGSYLATAAAWAGFRNDMASSFHAGYPLLIAPAFLMAHSPVAIWTFVKAINALLFSVTIISLSILAKLLRPELTNRTRLVSVVLVSLYPMWVVMTGYSFSENAFVPVFLLVCIAYLQCLHGGTAAWLLLGLLSGFLYWIHPKAIVVVIAASMGAIYIAFQLRSYRQLSIYFMSVTLMIVFYRLVLTPWLHSHMTISGLPPDLHYPAPGKLLQPFFTIEGLKGLFAHAGGHIFYLSIGSLGIVWIGVFSLVGNIFDHTSVKVESDVLKHKAIAILLTLSLVGTLALSVMLFTATPKAVRLDNWMYGRYVEGVIAPILLLGVMCSSFRNGLWAIPIAIFGALALNSGIKDYAHTAPFNISMFWQEFWLREEGLWVWLAIGCIPAILVSVLPRRSAIVLIGLAFCYSTYLQIKWHIAHSNVAIRRWEAANFIRDQYNPGKCVGFDQKGIDTNTKHVFWFDFGFVLFDFALQRTDFETWIKSCDGPLFSYDLSLQQRDDVYPVATSQLGGPVVWLKGEPLTKDVYPIIIAQQSVSLALMLGSGWHPYSPEKKYVWSSQRAELNLPVPDKCSSNQCSAVLTFSVFSATPDRPVNVIFKSNGPETKSLPSVVVRDSSIQKVSILLPSKGSLYEVFIDVPEATSPSALQKGMDKRVLGIALRSVELNLERPINYPISVAHQPDSFYQVLTSGWHSLESDHVWSSQHAELRLPVPDNCLSKRCNAVLTFSVMDASEQRPVNVVIKSDDSDSDPLASLVVKDNGLQTMTIPILAKSAIYPLKIDVPEATSPNALQKGMDKRVLGMALRSVELSLPTSALGQKHEKE